MVDILVRSSPSGPLATIPPGGTVVPLTAEFWVDSGRVGSTEDGSIGQPFLTIQAAIAAREALGPLVQGSINVSNADYSAENLAITMQLALFSNGNLIPVGNVDVTGAVNLHAENFAFGSFTNAAFSGTLNLVNCTMEDVNTGQFRPIDCSVFGDIINNDSIVAMNTTWEGGACEANTIELKQCRFEGGITATGVTADAYSVDALRVSGAVHAIGSLTISDNRYLQVEFVVPVLAGAFADVTVGALAASVRVNDTFSMAPIEGLMLANVAPVAAWCPIDGSITVRFFGTTAGGSFFLDLHRNTTHP